MPKLTKRIVDAAAADPNGQRLYMWDTDVKGFGLLVTPTGSKSYVLQYRVEGDRTRRVTIGRHGSPWTVEDARKRAGELLRGLADGIDPLVQKAEARTAITVAELVELYLVEGPAEKPNKKASSWKTDESNLRRHVLPLLGKHVARSLSRSDIAPFQRDVAAGKTARIDRTRPRGVAIIEGGKGTAARTLAVLGAMLQFAVKRGLIPANPAKGVQLFKGNEKNRFLSANEVAVLADTMAELEETHRLHPTMTAAIRLLMLTGARKSEILTLRWAWVDFDRACLRLPDSKTGAKVIPLATAAVELLRGLPRVSEYVLPATKGEGHLVGLQKAWEKLRIAATERARKAAEEDGLPISSAPDLTDLRIHDLRHSFASFAVLNGASLYLVGKVLGHQQIRTTQRYAHIANDPLRAVADNATAAFAGLIQAGK